MNYWTGHLVHYDVKICIILFDESIYLIIYKMNRDYGDDLLLKLLALSFLE
jgi:hypothetical protein